MAGIMEASRNVRIIYDEDISSRSIVMAASNIDE